MKRMACVFALATGTGIALGATSPSALAEPAPVAAASGLQIAIATPGAVTGDSTVTLEVTFRGGNLRSIELHIDGELIKKQSLRTREGRGVIQFTLDGLPEGSHDVLVKAVDTDGNTATSTYPLMVGRANDDLNALIRFTNLKKNQAVQGVLPIQLKLDASIRNPYVIFIIDNDFLAFMNYAPFTYNWDTTHIANGMHTISVEVNDGETLAKVKTLSMQVLVNNPGGFTNRQDTTPDLNRKPNKGGTANQLTKIAHAAAESSNPQTLDPQTPDSDLSRNVETIARSLNLRGSGAPTQSLGNPAALRGNAARTNPERNGAVNPTSMLGEAFGNLNLVSPEAKAARGALRTPLPSDLRAALPGALLQKRTARSAFANPIPVTRNLLSGYTLAKPDVMALLANPKDFNTSASELSPTSALARQTLRPLRSGNIAARPGTETGSVASVIPNGHSKPVADPIRVAHNPTKALVGGGALRNNLRVRSFEVAFDNTQIAFDVPPRVEHGMPLAPFRHIFEHTGGVVQWFNQSKTVRAFNTSREIEFRVGQKQAKVNNQPLKMEATPYIDRGRAIVPLSFVRDALNVNVHFDAKTGRLLIESKK